jgi:hypothetical protein
MVSDQLPLALARGIKWVSRVSSGAGGSTLEYDAVPGVCGLDAWWASSLCVCVCGGGCCTSLCSLLDAACLPIGVVYPDETVAS